MKKIKPLTVRELIKYLSNLDQDMEVRVKYPNCYDVYTDTLEDWLYYVYEDEENELAILDCRFNVKGG